MAESPGGEFVAYADVSQHIWELAKQVDDFNADIEREVRGEHRAILFDPTGLRMKVRELKSKADVLESVRKMVAEGIGEMESGRGEGDPYIYRLAELLGIEVKE